MRHGSLMRGAFLTAALLSMASGALAQDPPEIQEERRALNAEQAKLAADLVADYQARKAAVAEEQAARDVAYKRALREHDAQVAAIKAKAAEDQARWEAAVAACKAGDYSQCGPRQP
ncbi:MULTISPECIES: hypothetical protein [Sphingobium]|uniref:Peptidoglycan hydrolase CwlO-like protein n=1 Tax=Sphingobium lignivorans TaxID=2735886 RepID=A0ABR6NIT4_9SPHN|nr:MULTISPECIES: hypothetical protein [Sphingobium]MBB5987184.1 peptidoglycan hydrolase CwlO-like protein [Sphingobium lignivorans]